MTQAAKSAQQGWTAFWAVFALALGLRVVLLGQHAFHMDEALYATFSRRILHGDLLLTGGLNNDKPPFQFYLGALGLGLFGESESSIRWMNALCSALECGLLAWALVPVAGVAAALGAGFLLAASPLHRSYGATAIMDGPFSLFFFASFMLAARGRAWASGLAWGLALTCKQTALFFLPLPILAVLLRSDLRGRDLRAWAQGALWPVLGLGLWSLLFAHPRLGAFVGMSAHQPEVGLKLAGLGDRFVEWARLSGGLFLWPTAMTVALVLAPLVASALLLKGGAGARPWSLGAMFSLFGILVFAAMNMRSFDRYPVAYAWAVCALPALAASVFVADSFGRQVFGVAALVLGLGALFGARSQALPLDQQGVAGDRYDGYRALLLDLKQREPLGGALVSGQGGLRWMGGWYLGSGWALSESPELPAAEAAKVYAAERQGASLPAGRWRKVAAYPGFGPPPQWELFVAEGKRP